MTEQIIKRPEHLNHNRVVFTLPSKNNKNKSSSQENKNTQSDGKDSNSLKKNDIDY